jgi:hypothetical protein
MIQDVRGSAASSESDVHAHVNVNVDMNVNVNVDVVLDADVVAVVCLDGFGRPLRPQGRTERSPALER